MHSLRLKMLVNTTKKVRDKLLETIVSSLIEIVCPNHPHLFPVLARLKNAREGRFLSQIAEPRITALKKQCFTGFFSLKA